MPSTEVSLDVVRTHELNASEGVMNWYGIHGVIDGHLQDVQGPHHRPHVAYPGRPVDIPVTGVINVMAGGKLAPLNNTVERVKDALATATASDIRPGLPSLLVRWRVAWLHHRRLGSRFAGREETGEAILCLAGGRSSANGRPCAVAAQSSAET